LLRKRRYNVSAAFFLLAEPPSLKSALEIIATKMQDLNLAFLVARLVESPEIKASDPLKGGSVGGGLGFGGFMGLGGGGGGGYASTPPVVAAVEAPIKEEDFEKWVPRLKAGARNLLLDRGLAHSEKDNCLTAVQLMWLGQRDEASCWLTGLSRDTGGTSKLPDVGDGFLPAIFDLPVETRGYPSSPTTSLRPSLRVCSRVNALLDFLSGPLLLRTMGASKRPKFASALTLSSILIRSGIELPSVQSLLRHSDRESMTEEKVEIGDEETKEMSMPNPQQASSIFDEFDVPARQPKPAAQAQSSIFDDFSRAPLKQTTATSSSGGMNSSIFDSFDATAKPSRPANNGQMQSSIFDTFDAPPPPKKAAGNAAPEPMQSSIFDSFDAAPPPKKTTVTKPAESSIFADFDTAPSAKPKNVQKQSAAMTPSIFDSFDGPSATTSATQSKTPAESSTSNIPEKNKEEEEEIKLDTIVHLETPALWQEWREGILLYASERRLLRELACLMVEMLGDAFDPPKLSFALDKESLLPGAVAEILQLPCEGETIVDRIRELVGKICDSHEVTKEALVPLALRLFAIPQHHDRMFYAVLLHLAENRGDLAEDLDAAHLMMQRCDTFALSNDPPSGRGKTSCHMVSLYLRRKAARLSWQLELCLRLHRGGALPLSGVAINEAIVAVRVGFALARWNRNYECLETLIKCEPDCHMNNEAGRQLWTSLKMVSNADGKVRSSGKASSGGWEFLVDCRRSEATDLLRHKPTWCFIIRPHVEDHGVFTLSFKTNLVPTPNPPPPEESTETSTEQSGANKPPLPKPSRPVKKDDVVQHAIIRLSDSGFRCGSFGPFGSLMKLLEAVSSSLPFDLRFDQPPAERVIKDEGSQPSPNAVFLRKLVLRHADSMVAHPPSSGSIDGEPNTTAPGKEPTRSSSQSEDQKKADEEEKNLESFRQSAFGIFLELLTLSAIRKPLSAVATSKYEDQPMLSEAGYLSSEQAAHSIEETNSDDNSETKAFCSFDEQYAGSSRMLRPFFSWCRMLQLSSECEFAPGLSDVSNAIASPQITLAASETAIEAIEEDAGRGDSIIRRMIQPNSGVDFRTLRLADGGDSTVVVLFSKNEAMEWLMKFVSKESALEKLAMMERIRVIEPIDLSRLQLKAYSTQKGAKLEEDTGVRYRIVDPWEVEALDSREGETKSASIGRERFLAFSLGHVATACETLFRKIGGLPALELWTSTKGGVALTKAIASVHPPWERGEGGDMQFVDGVARETSPFTNSTRQHLYRNSLFRSIHLPQRFLALVQVELLDLKNLTVPGGSLALTVYALLRLRRSDSGAPLTSKTRTLDSAATLPMKLAKSTGPNAPALWGSVVRFRFPLPEDVSCDG
jgi:hypothetical protein